MAAVPKQTLDFLRASAPFDLLEEQDLLRFASQLTLAYVTAQNYAEILENQQSHVFLINSGQFSVKDSDGPQKHLSEGGFFNVSNAINDTQSKIELDVDSSGLVYCIPYQVFQQIRQQNSAIAKFFLVYDSEIMQQEAVSDSNSMWLYRDVSEVVSGSAICGDANMSINKCAKKMAENSVSCLLITEQGTLTGIITDRDLRNRVVAKDLDLRLPVSQIMSANPVQITHQSTVFDALCAMSEHNIHHLPVVDKISKVPMGMLTASDMIRLQKGNVLFIIAELSKADSLYELTRLSWQIPHYFAKHAKRLGDFDVAGKILSQATDIMTRKLLRFFQQKNGVPPIDYCWLVYGSQAREDQTLGSDQDNALLLEREPTTAEDDYFAKMSDYVCQGLGKCGIKLCDGNIMASNPKLRLSVDAAVKETLRWVNEPTSKAIMHFNIFLDVRAVAGNTVLLTRLQKARTPELRQPIFIAALARHANEGRVPLSMFQKFIFETGSKKPDSINLKIGAMALINNIVRIYALANAITLPSTLDRLTALSETKDLSAQDIVNLRDIWLFLSRLRWRHQLQNNTTDNCVSIADLSSIEKHQLKAAFQAISRAQQALIMKFSSGIG
jgi:CBS domain-containing protein